MKLMLLSCICVYPCRPTLVEVFQFLECCQTGKPTPLLRSELVQLQQHEQQQQQQHAEQQLPQHPVEQQLAELLQQKGKQQQQHKNAGKDMSWSEVTYEDLKDAPPGVQGGSE
jgi:hypothetical protein